MRFTEFSKLTEDDELGYYDPTQDNYDKLSLDKPRQQKVTLRTINRLKKMRLTKKVENAVKQELLGAMYAQPEGDDQA